MSDTVGDTAGGLATGGSLAHATAEGIHRTAADCRLKPQQGHSNKLAPHR